MANWYCDPFDQALQAGADRDPRRAARARTALESRRDAARRGHPSPPRHSGPPRQGGRDPTGVRGRDDPCRRSSAARDRREPAGADRRRGAERGRQHAAARTFRRGVVRETPAAQSRACICGCRRCPAIPASTIGAAWLFAHLAGAPRGAPMTHAFYCGTPPSHADIAAALEADDIASQRIGDISTPEGRDAIADLMAFMVAQSGVIAIYQGAAETGPRALGHRSILANPCDPQARASGSTSASNTAKRSARWRRWRRWKRRSNISSCCPGASDADYNAYNYMVLTAQSKPRRARQNPGGHPCRRHRPHPDRARGRRSPHLRLSEGARPPHRRRDVRSTRPSTSPARSPRRRNRQIDTLRRSKGLDVVRAGRRRRRGARGLARRRARQRPVHRLACRNGKAGA